MNDSAQGRSAFIWDLPALWTLLDHPSETVGEWAASHMLELYPEATEQALAVLPQVSPTVAYPLLESLKELPLPASGVEPLVQLIQSDKEAHSRAMAIGLLFRLGRTPSEDDLAGLPIQTLLRHLPDTDSSFEFLIQEWRRSREGEGPLIQVMAKLCNVDDLFYLLENSSTKELRQNVRSLEKFWHIKLPPIRKVKDLGEARRLLQDTLTSTGEPDPSASSHFPSLIGQLQRDRERIATLIELTKEFEATNAGETTLVLACVLALFRDAACLKGLSDTSDVPEVWRNLPLRPWRGTEVDLELLVLLGGQDQEGMLSGLREALSSGWAYFGYSFYVLKALTAPCHQEVFQEALDGQYGDEIADEARSVEALMLKDPEAMEALLDRWRQQLPDPHRLHLLDEYPTERTVQFLLEHLDHYMSQPFSRYVVEVMEEVASPSFLEPLAREWCNGEEHLRRAIWFLAELHGLEGDKSIQQIPRVTEEERYQQTEMLMDSDKFAEALGSKQIPLPLRCTACQRSYRYQLERVYVGKSSQDITLGQIVQCKGCGTLETCEITDETLLPLTTELMRIKVLEELQEDDEEIDTFIIGQPVVITSGGQTFRSISEVYHFLEEAVQREPESAELNRRLGNVMRNGLRPDLAISYYQEAIRLDQKEIDSVHSLAAILLDQERYREAVPYVENLVTLCRDPELDEALCRDIFGELLDLVAFIEVKTGRRIELYSPPRQRPEIEQGTEDPLVVELLSLDPENRQDFEQMYHLFRHGTLPKGRSGRRWRELEPDLRHPAIEAPIRVNKIGRNEPCPCGSGKKYKRCCGR